MVGLDNPIHILFLLILLLLVFGAKRLPEMGRSLGSGMRGFKDSLNGVTNHEAELPRPMPVAATLPADSQEQTIVAAERQPLS
jgi:sec-independent protein translocase protein TatA